MAFPYPAVAVSPFPVLRLRGLPFTASEADVRTFMAPIECVDVLLLTRGGRPSGEGFVVVGGGPGALAAASAKDRGYVGRRWIEIFPSRRLDYYRAVAAEITSNEAFVQSLAPPTPAAAIAAAAAAAARSGAHLAPGPAPKPPLPTAAPPADRGTVLRLRGLPYTAGEADVRTWCAAAPGAPAPTAVHILRGRDGRPTGQAYVSFATTADAEAAASRDRATMSAAGGGPPRYVEVFWSTDGELERATAAVAAAGKLAPPPSAAAAAVADGDGDDGDEDGAAGGSPPGLDTLSL